MPRLPVLVPAVAGLIMFAWGLLAPVVEPSACDPAPWQDGVSSWAVLGVFLTLALSGVTAGLLAHRLEGWPGLMGTIAAVVLIVVGAEVGWIVAHELMDCVRGDEGPGLTVAIFAVPSALVGYPIGWVLRRADPSA